MKKYISTVLKRPISAILLIISVVLFGISSLTSMQLEYFPDLDMPMEVVYMVYPGADADTVRADVIELIENIGDNLTGIETVESTSNENYGTVQFSYAYGTDLDSAYSELKAALDNIASDFPTACQAPTIMEISLDADATVKVAAQSVTGTDILKTLNDTVVPSLESINGVASVDVNGSSDTYLKVVLDEEKLKQYGLSLGSVASYMSAAKFNMPVGEITSGDQNINAVAYSDIDWQDDLSNIAINTSSGQVIHLSDVASTMNLFQTDVDSIDRYNGQSSYIMDITKKSTGATIAVCNEVEQKIQQMENEDITYTIIHSSKDDIMNTLMEVLKTLVEGILFSMVVLFLFFGDIKASFIVGSSMPLSLLGAIVVMKLFGMPFDLMSGTGMIVAIGMLVDNSIVILESCFRAKEGNLDTKDAALLGSSSMIGSVFASTLTTIVVYAPIAVTSGLSGQMNQPLCYAIIFTMVASFISAITVVPLLFVLVKPRAKKDIPVNRILRFVGKGYEKIIGVVLKHAKLTVLMTAVLFLGAILLASTLQFDIFPPNYDGSIIAEIGFRSGTKLEIMDEKVQQMEADLNADEHFESVELIISDHTATMTAYSKDGSRSSEEAVDYYIQKWKNETGMNINVTPTGVSTGLSSLMSSGNSVTITLEGEDLNVLEEGAAIVEDTFTKIPGVLKTDNIFSNTKTSVKFCVDQQKAIAAGFQPSAVATQIYYLLSGINATTIKYLDGTDYDVKVQLPDDKYNDPMILLDQMITNTSGRTVALKDIASIEYADNIQSIKRVDKKYIAEITATVESSDKYQIESNINEVMKTVTFPTGVTQAESTLNKTMGKEMTSLGNAMIAAVFLVFLVMAVQFESIRFSIMVMTCIPFSLIGSFALMFLFGEPLSMMAMMGILMLIGMVVNNGILLVDGINELRKEMSLETALVQAGLTRLRPILMTTLTTVLSMLPLLISGNSGMNMMKGMGIIIVGGLCTSTVLALFVMPAFYLILQKKPKKN